MFSSPRAPAARSQGTIQAFTRVAKVTVEIPAPSKKRKVTFVDEIDTSATVNSKRNKVEQKTPEETPTKSCKRAIASLTLQTPVPALKGSKRKRTQQIAEESIHSPPTPPASQDSSDLEDAASADLPQELYDFISLNDAFLSALSLHCAHNGSSMSVDVRTLTPSITKLWGKRKVGIDDLRLCLGILQNNSSATSTKSNTFLLTNFGNGRIHLTLTGPKRRAGKVIGQPFNERQLRRLFVERVESAWSKWSSSQMDDLEWSRFKECLPVAEVKMSASAAMPHPLIAKGQQRLEDLTKARDASVISSPINKKRKTSPADALTEITNKQAATSPAKSPAQSIAGKENDAKSDIGSVTATIRGLSLFERIREKELAQASLPRPPTKEELEHRSALQRCEEMLSILDMLATSKGSGMRASFPLPSFIRSVQSSVRSPMAKEEIERCVRVLEKEVAPGYVSMVKFGGMVGVVVNRLSKPSEDMVKQRLNAGGM